MSLFIGWPFTSQLALSLTTQPGVPNYKIFPPITTNNQDNEYPTDIPIGPSDLGNQSRFPSQVILGGGKLTSTMLLVGCGLSHTLPCYAKLHCYN